MMKAFHSVAFALLFTFPCLAQEEGSPSFTATSLPFPPQQSEPWTQPQTSLPELVSAADTLFKQGMPDPRGCEYRNISVEVGSVWGGSGGVIKTHGWVIPTTGGEKFGIAWNGLVYPLLSVGEKVNLDTDLTTILTEDQKGLDAMNAQDDLQEKQRKEQAERTGQKYQPFPHSGRLVWVRQEAPNVAWQGLRPLQIPLVLRLGKTKFAEEMWNQWNAGMSPQAIHQDTYLSLVHSWAWARYDRAVCAHMRGEDHLSLLDAQALTNLLADVESEATRRQLPRPQNQTEQSDKPLPYLQFENLGDLLADEQRRVTEPPYDPASSAKLTGPARIDALIHDLEFVSARQFGQPGGVDLAQDPVVEQLIARGDDAVEPLLNCLEKDTRLTRSVRFWRDFSESRTLLGVHEAAYTALANILHTDFFSSGSTSDSLTARGLEGRKEVADRIREYWQKNKGLSLQDRWYATLQDDSAAPDQWLQAAENIIQPGNVQVNHGSAFVGMMMIQEKALAKPCQLPEKSYAQKTNPSVSDLIIKRMNGLVPNPNVIPDSHARLKNALGLVLAKWDGKDHLPELRALSEFDKSGLTENHGEYEMRVQSLLDLYQARIDCGDPDAVADYADWLPSLHREWLDFAISKVFVIMAEHPNDPHIQEAARQVFEKSDSPWVPLLGKQAYYANSLISTPLIGLASFRIDLLQGMKDRSRAGSENMEKNGCSITVDGGWSGGGGDVPRGDGETPPPIGSTVDFRVCDLYTFEICQIPGAPPFHLYWPEAKRDAGVKACAAFLQRYGDCYQYKPSDAQKPWDPFYPQGERATFHLPRLDRPATEDDVANARAIFTLKGQTRLWKMPQWPMQATWPLSKKQSQSPQEAMDGYRASIGEVYQSEEVFVDGRWKRYFGYVGARGIAQVPAEEIEFPNTNDGRMGMLTGNALNENFDCTCTIPVKSAGTAAIPSSNFNIGGDFPFTLKLYNRSGLDLPLPQDLRTKPLSLTLRFIEFNPMQPAARPSKDWQPLPMKSGTTIPVPVIDQKILGPTDSTDILTINLKDYFQITQPGMYEIAFGIGDCTAPERFMVQAP